MMHVCDICGQESASDREERHAHWCWKLTQIALNREDRTPSSPDDGTTPPF
ncbi:hypothetical protein SEA_HUPHLEPUFF_109 [Mycobacterium phage Huphlepuff]|uniref:Uncharacterized protein n=4 Tax=Marvinvirus marvin TaxID=1982092 RepID=A0A3G8FEX7_9CAUD|nr:hypothetical protein SEA_BEELZEBUB_113 [Mycobacterium phage Beelzebub]QFP97657.1 hypothetical protein SEA_CORAZON_102 [Mycobacterium phage Corazon]URP22600.1 hypothetical protein SEA_HUPHLEPUFF_109 [Mycobacterium phage Huphlepuff]